MKPLSPDDIVTLRAGAGALWSAACAGARLEVVAEYADDALVGWAMAGWTAWGDDVDRYEAA